MITDRNKLWRSFHGDLQVEVRKHSSGMQGNIKVGIDFLNHLHEAGNVFGYVNPSDLVK